ncbi:hypothetical protein BN2537_9727 [Streptomyces venezuelae]|nr:hypothetical protein BN2537_9727 [Streptomyces venezuelae]
MGDCAGPQLGHRRSLLVMGVLAFERTPTLQDLDSLSV